MPKAGSTMSHRKKTISGFQFCITLDRLIYSLENLLATLRVRSYLVKQVILEYFINRTMVEGVVTPYPLIN